MARAYLLKWGQSLLYDSKQLKYYLKYLDATKGHAEHPNPGVLVDYVGSGSEFGSKMWSESDPALNIFIKNMYFFYI